MSAIGTSSLYQNSIVNESRAINVSSWSHLGEASDISAIGAPDGRLLDSSVGILSSGEERVAAGDAVGSSIGASVTVPIIVSMGSDSSAGS